MMMNQIMSVVIPKQKKKIKKTKPKPKPQPSPEKKNALSVLMENRQQNKDETKPKKTSS